MKTAIINEVKSAKKTTLTGLDVSLTLSIMSKEAPTERTGILNKLANVNKARETFFANLPKFTLLHHQSQAKFPRIPNIIYFDFPSAYINFPETPDFRILAELPGNLGDRAFFFVHHGYPLREMRTETESFNPSKVDNKKMLDTFYKYSQKYGKMLFSSEGMTTEAYQKLNKEFTAEVLAQKAVIADKIKNSLQSSLTYQNPAAKGQLTLIEDEKSGYTMSDKTTDICLADPETIDTEESVGEVEITQRLKNLMVDIKHLSQALKNLVAENVTFTKNFHDFMLAQKPVKNKDFTQFFQTPALKKHLDAVSMMDQKRAHEFINNLGKLEDVMDQAKTLWTMADMMQYLPEYKVYAHKGEQLKSLLTGIIKLQFFWKAAKVYTYDTHLHLDLRLKEIVSANKADENQGFEYLLNWSDSIHGSLLELKKFPESFVENFEDKMNDYLNFDTDEPVKLIGGSK